MKYRTNKRQELKPNLKPEHQTLTQNVRSEESRTGPKEKARNNNKGGTAYPGRPRKGNPSGRTQTDGEGGPRVPRTSEADSLAGCSPTGHRCSGNVTSTGRSSRTVTKSDLRPTPFPWEK